MGGSGVSEVGSNEVEQGQEDSCLQAHGLYDFSIAADTPLYTASYDCAYGELMS